MEGGVVNRRLSCVWMTVVLAGVLPGIITAGEWQIDRVDDSRAPGRYSSMKVDKDGNIHVAYSIVDQNFYPLRYGFWDASVKKWFTMEIDRNAAICSLALDSEQRPHIAYAQFDSGGIRYAYFDRATTTWQKQQVPLPSQSLQYYLSLALSPENNPNISFYEYEGPRGTDLRIRMRNVMRVDSNRWELRTVDEDPGSGKFNAMVADAQGHMHLAYANVSAGTGGMRYAYWDGKTWHPEILEGLRENNGEGVGFSCILTLDKSGAPHLSYMNESTGLVKYAVKRNGRWHMEVVGRVAAVGYPDRNSIALDEEERPYIGYYDAGRGVLLLAHREGSQWVSEVVDATHAGFTSSMQIDRGIIHITYGDDMYGGLKAAHLEVANRARPGILPTKAESTKVDLKSGRR